MVVEVGPEIEQLVFEIAVPRYSLMRRLVPTWTVSALPGACLQLLYLLTIVALGPC
jgi:hypothetical protein